jgi:tetrathionate reductase subunit B
MTIKNKQYGMVVDIDVCTIACKQENKLAPTQSDIPGSRKWPEWITVHRLLKGTYPDLSMHYLPILCMHCKSAPCIEVCPYQAIYRRSDGIVLIDEQLCDGCKNIPEGPKCVPACPYDAVYLDDRKQVAMKCSLCAHRIDAGLEPACVKACEGQCLLWGDLADPNSEVSSILRAAGDKAFVLKPEEETDSNVWYIKTENLSPAQISSLMKKVGVSKAPVAKKAKTPAKNVRARK